MATLTTTIFIDVASQHLVGAGSEKGANNTSIRHAKQGTKNDPLEPLLPLLFMRATAIVSGKGAQRWADGHPWIFRSDLITAPSTDAAAVTVLDNRRRPIG